MKFRTIFIKNEYSIFSYVVEITGNVDLASGIVQNYLSKDYIKEKREKICCSSLETGSFHQICHLISQIVHLSPTTVPLSFMDIKTKFIMKYTYQV